MASPIRVLVVDDSPLFVETIQGILDEDPEIQVVGVANDGRQAVEEALRLRPDVITIDVHMPVMDGLEAISEIMASCPTPILVVTSDPGADGSELHFEAIGRGALDVLPKPTVWKGTAPEQEALREHVKLLAGVAVVQRAKKRPSRESISQRIARALLKAVTRLGPDRAPAPIHGHLLGFAASTGGPSALALILEELPVDFPATILVVQHIFDGFADSLASWLDGKTSLKVCVAENGASITPGTVLVAPDGWHLTVVPSDGAAGRVALTSGSPSDPHRPSGNQLFESMAAVYGRAAIGVILTGMGDDGVAGLEAIRKAGGVTLAQDEGSSVVYGMPRLADERGAAQQVVPLSEMADVVCGLLGVRPRPR
jgi:two-component system chemotaxis response regulator CheB